MSRERRERLALLVLAGLAALVTYLIATQVFPYHSSNHDEGVYLQQAAMLLEGTLFLEPPVDGAFRPWFFVDSADGLYPKYAPVPAAMFALGELLGGYRLALAGVAAGTVALTARTVAEAFDRPTGLLAAGLSLASPLFLVNAAVFLPYVPTTLLNLAFAAAYLHADRTGSVRSAAVAGFAIGAAFFARPFTAVLFAAPFVVHACWTLYRDRRDALTRQATTAALGLAGVAVALGYNAVTTGDPLLFPYEAFAPRDGLGFGHREIQGYEREYNPALALRANAEALWLFATRWVVAGALGTAVAAAGFAVALRRGLDHRQATVGGLLLSVPLGNVYFWGNLNLLGDLSRASDGLVALHGPFYHLDLLVPTAAFGAVGTLALWRGLREHLERRTPPSDTGRAAVAALVVVAGVGGAATVGAAADPLADNYEVTQAYDRAYAPFEERDLSESVVLLPTPYGNWLNHPFQALRNDPSYDDGPVYATRADEFGAVDAFPDRAHYRYGIRGDWAPTTGRTVDPTLDRVEVVEGERVRQDVALGVPSYAELVSLELSTTEGSDAATVRDPADLSLTVDVTADGATLAGEGVDETVAVPVADEDAVVLTALVDFGTAYTFRYRVELPVERTDDGVRALSPYAEVCRDERLCDGEAAYVPGEHRDGVVVETTLTAP